MCCTPRAPSPGSPLPCPFTPQTRNIFPKTIPTPGVSYDQGTVFDIMPYRAFQYDYAIELGAQEQDFWAVGEC